jgi:hypothetical protein
MIGPIVPAQENQMIKTLGAASLLIAAIATPVNDARAQDILGGALLGGAAGALIGGAVGGGRGAAIGAVIGSGTGAVIAAEGQRRGAYWYHNNGCYVQRPDGSFVPVSPAYCGGPAYAPARPVAGDPVAYCMQRYRSYDPRSGTYMGHDGFRRPCP